MHYNIGPKILIKTENAAKSVSQRSAYLAVLIKNLPRAISSFDYGCGKLRYTDTILHTTDTLALVDSDIQISRRQVLCGQYTNIREIGLRSNHLSVYTPNEFAGLVQKFERGFCINVLSTIPYFSVRQRVIRLIRRMLEPGGICIFVVQYRNSDFVRMCRMPNARPWRDGFLIDSLRGFSFYGLISPERLADLVLAAGFQIEEQKLNDGSVYLFARGD